MSENFLLERLVSIDLIVNRNKPIASRSMLPEIRRETHQEPIALNTLLGCIAFEPVMESTHPTVLRAG